MQGRGAVTQRSGSAGADFLQARSGREGDCEEQEKPSGKELPEWLGPLQELAFFQPWGR